MYVPSRPMSSQPVLAALRPEHVIGKTLAWIALFGFCCANAPLPVLVAPLEFASKEGSVPFPCQGCHCGCKNATQCWTSCCCYSLSERLAWAKRNGVTPPAFVTRMQAETTPAKAPVRSCCAAKNKAPVKSCCSNRSSASNSSCHSQSESCPEQTDIVFAFIATKCHGGYHTCTSLPWTILSGLAS